MQDSHGFLRSPARDARWARKEQLAASAARAQAASHAPPWRVEAARQEAHRLARAARPAIPPRDPERLPPGAEGKPCPAWPLLRSTAGVNDFLAIPVLQSEVDSHARKVSISGHPTVYRDGQQAAPADPMASHRPEMVGQLRAARERIDGILARSGNAPSARTIATAALDSIAHLEGLIASGRVGPADMAALASVLTTAHATATALEAALSTTAAQAAEQLVTASTAARATVQSVMSGMRDFDGQLQFASNDDQRAYREQEAERRVYVQAQLATGTPEGNLNAAGATMGQMADAKAHGAGGPEFDMRWGELVATTEKLRDAAKANGVSTEEFDRHLRADLRRFMKAKGLSDAQIDARFAVTPDPLEAAKAYVQDDEISALAHSLGSSEARPSTPPPAIEPAISTISDAMTKFRAAGIVEAQPTGSAFAHGVAVREKAADRAERSLPG